MPKPPRPPKSTTDQGKPSGYQYLWGLSMTADEWNQVRGVIARSGKSIEETISQYLLGLIRKEG